MHFCSSEFEEKLPELVEKIKGKDTVVFHCAKSQVSLCNLCITSTYISPRYKYTVFAICHCISVVVGSNLTCIVKVLDRLEAPLVQEC